MRRLFARRPRLHDGTGRLPMKSACATAALLFASLAYYHWNYEGWLQTITFASFVTLSLISGLTLLTRRLLLSVAVVAAVVAMIVIASDVKRRYIEMVLHAYDVVFYLTSLSTIRFLWVDHRLYLVALVVAFIMTGALACWLYRADPTRVPRALSAVLFALFAAAGMWAAEAKGERKNTQFYWDNQYLASFYASWSETLETLMRGQLLEALASQRQPLFKTPENCTPAASPPHIILIHQESVVPPAQFPAVSYDKTMDSFFKSFDGETHKLRVETYGGASWLTEFSVLAGVSTYSFGGMRTFVQSLMQGKIHDTLPEALTRCGYQNAVFYPVPKDFVSNGRFYAAVGMPQIFDFKAQGAKIFNERDAFYYGNVLKYFEESFATARKPTFTFMLTSATHLPYNFTYAADVTVPGGGPGTDPEMHEYLRRLSLARIDYEAFRDELRRRFPNERFLIVQYGDHQPVATRIYLGIDTSATAEEVKLPPDSAGFTTYYAIEGINYDPPAMPAVDILEVPFLGTVLLHAARLPISEAYAERRRLLEVCAGRYYTCANRNAILGFHRRLIDSGLVQSR